MTEGVTTSIIALRCMKQALSLWRGRRALRYLVHYFLLFHFLRGSQQFSQSLLWQRDSYSVKGVSCKSWALICQKAWKAALFKALDNFNIFILMQWRAVRAFLASSAFRNILFGWFGDVRLQDLPTSGTKQTHTWLFLWPPPHNFLLCVNAFFPPLAEFHLRFTLTHTYLHTYSSLSFRCVYRSEICKQTWSLGMKKHERWRKLEMKQ